MKNLDQRLTKSIQEFNAINHAVIDSSSILYIYKSGFMSILSKQIKLISPEQVKNEINFTCEYVTFFEYNNSKNYDTDDIIVITATQKELPVISDDKYILKYASEKNLPYFNSIMMLIFLFFKKEINLDEFNSFQKNLYDFAYYSKKVVDYAENLFNVIKANQNS